MFTTRKCLRKTCQLQPNSNVYNGILNFLNENASLEDLSVVQNS